MKCAHGCWHSYVDLSIGSIEHFRGFLYPPFISMGLSREDVLALGQLARIALDEDEAARAERELDSVLGYVDRLQRVPTDGVEEASPTPLPASAFRVDEAIPCDDAGRALIIGNFPAKQNDLLKAPAVFERPKK